MTMTRAIIVLSLLFLTACGHSYKGVAPVKPEISGRLGRILLPPNKVESLQPTLEWTPGPDAGVTYDVIIYAGVAQNDYWVAGKQVYLREGLTTTKHTVDQALSPDTTYVWSVRTVSNGKRSAWSQYSDQAGSGMLWGSERHNFMWTFKTPGK